MCLFLKKNLCELFWGIIVVLNVQMQEEKEIATKSHKDLSLP